MAQRDFYQILGIRPNATADQIKSAYRDLVKRCHPDLFSNETAKRRATEKLQEINEAYAVLGEEERRREYDESRRQSYESRRQSYEARVRKRPAAKQARATRRPPPRQSGNKFFGRLKWKSTVPFKAGAAIAAMLVVLILADAVWTAFQDEQTAWILSAKTVVEPAPVRVPVAGPDWMNLGRYKSRLECTGNLQEFVKRDERQGHRSVVDETGGTIAITVSIKGEEALAQEYFESKLRQAGRAGPDEIPVEAQQLLRRQARDEAREFISKNGLSKRETTYACREIRLARPEPVFRKLANKLSDLWP